VIIPNKICEHADSSASCECLMRQLCHPVSRNSLTSGHDIILSFSDDIISDFYLYKIDKFGYITVVRQGT
jgi:hypothetical protein